MLFFKKIFLSFCCCGCGCCCCHRFFKVSQVSFPCNIFPLPFQIVRLLKDTPKTNAVSVKSKKPSTFHEFARSTNDAWDIDDEEDGGFFTPSHSAPVPAQSHSTVKAPRLKDTNRMVGEEPEPRPGDRLEPGSSEVSRDQRKTDSESANGRVLKSSSDVQLNSHAGINSATMF